MDEATGPGNYTASEMIQRGEQASRLLGDSLLQEAFEAVEREYLKAWRNAPTQEIREHCWHSIHGIDSIKAALRMWMNEGMVDDDRLKV